MVALFSFDMIVTGATAAIGDMLTSLLLEKTVTMESHATLLLLRIEITGEYQVEYTAGDEGGDWIVWDASVSSVCSSHSM